MLKKKFRLSNFSLLSPTQISTKFFNLKYSRNNSDLNRLAFVVSKKTDKRSTQRNRLKRKTRAAFEHLFGNIKEGHDFIVYPKKETASVTSNEIEKELKSTLSKSGLLKNEKN
jgi:ribonuclease P protein component